MLFTVPYPPPPSALPRVLSDTSVQHFGCWALANVGWGQADVQKFAREEGAIEAIQVAKYSFVGIGVVAIVVDGTLDGAGILSLLSLLIFVLLVLSKVPIVELVVLSLLQIWHISSHSIVRKKPRKWTWVWTLVSPILSTDCILSSPVQNESAAFGRRRNLARLCEKGCRSAERNQDESSLWSTMLRIFFLSTDRTFAGVPPGVTLAERMEWNTQKTSASTHHL